MSCCTNWPTCLATIVCAYVTNTSPKYGELAGRAESALKQALAQVPPAQGYVVALSGGLDSLLLLLAMAEHNRDASSSLRALHINHGLSPNADAWQRHCQQQCANLALPFEAFSVQLTGERGGIEAEARKLRYQVFARELKPGELLLLGHHQDDQLETILMRMNKGLDVSLLAGIPRERIWRGCRAFRPLLDLPRAQLESWARAMQLSWVEDESNRDLRFRRNALRHQVLPKLDATARKQVLGLAEQAQVFTQLKQRLATRYLKQCSQQGFLGQQVLQLSALKALSPEACELVLRTWLSELQAEQPSTKILQRFHSEFIQAQADSKALLKWAGGELRLYAGLVYFEPEACQAWRVLEPCECPDDGAQPKQLALTCGAYRIEFSGKAYQHVARSAQQRIKGQRLKEYWRQIGLPLWLRSNFPLLARGDELLWAGGPSAGDWPQDLAIKFIKL